MFDKQLISIPIYNITIILPCIVAKYEAVREAILMAINKEIPKIIINSDSQVVVNTINGRTGIPKDIIILVEDIRCLLNHFKDSRLEYYCKRISRDADALAKLANM